MRLVIESLHIVSHNALNKRIKASANNNASRELSAAMSTQTRRTNCEYSWRVRLTADCNNRQKEAPLTSKEWLVSCIDAKC